MKYGQGNYSFSQQPVYYVNPQPVVIPGLKVAYGVQPSSTQPVNGEQSKNWLGRLKNTVVNLVTEAADSERPIGITQLSRNTFFAAPQASTQTVVQRSNPFQDYRFRFIAEPR